MQIGWKEWVVLPQLNLPMIKAKIDTGAKTSALHTFRIEVFEQSAKQWVRFWIHPHQDDNETEVVCTAPLKDKRSVMNSGGYIEDRYVIETSITMGQETWPIEVTLTNRDALRYRMLIGRQAMKNLTIKPSAQFLLGQPE